VGRCSHQARMVENAEYGQSPGHTMAWAAAKSSSPAIGECIFHVREEGGQPAQTVSKCCVFPAVPVRVPSGLRSDSR